MTFPFPIFSPVSSVYTAHRYWRIYITAINSINNAEVNQLSFYGVGGTEIPATGGSALSSGYFGTAYPSKAFDNNLSDYWISNDLVDTAPQWVGYDFGSGNKVDVRSIAITSNEPNRAPSEFLVQYSDDGSVWTTVVAIHEQVGWGIYEVRSFQFPTNPYDAKRMWRINVTANNGSLSGVLLQEIAFKNAGGVTLPTTGFGWGSSRWDANSRAKFAFDGNTSTGWQTATNTYPQWAAYDYGTGNDVVRVDLTNSVLTATAPKDFDIQYSQDGVTWTTAWSVTDATGWSASETRTFLKP